MIKKVFFVIVLFASLSLLAGVKQKKETHQYIVRQAWELAKYQYPALENTDLADHIGDSENGDKDHPWSNGFVVLWCSVYSPPLA